MLREVQTAGIVNTPDGKLAIGWTLVEDIVMVAALAQIGEFSFVLAVLGVELGLMTPEAQNLILAGALLSIGLNPFIFRLLSRFGAMGQNS